MTNLYRGKWAGYAACALAGLLWSFGFLLGKIALREMNSEAMVLYRFVFAAMGMAPVAAWSWQRGARMRGRELRILLLGAFMGFPLLFFSEFRGLELTTVSHAALMVGATPMILALAAVLFTGEHLDGLGWLTLVASSVGVALIVVSHARVIGGPQPSLVGDLMVVVSTIMATGWMLLNKQLMHRFSSLTVASFSLMAGTGMIAAWVYGRAAFYGVWPPFAAVSWQAWAALAASGLLCTTVTTLAWNWGVQRVPASRAGVFLNIESAFGSALGVMLLGEHLGPLALVGGVLIVASAVGMTMRGH